MHEYTVYRRQVKSFENAALEPFFLVINSAACWEKACKKRKKKRENAANLKHSKHNVDPNSAYILWKE